jgi:hypothetical protein
MKLNNIIEHFIVISFIVIFIKPSIVQPLQTTFNKNIHYQHNNKIHLTMERGFGGRIEDAFSAAKERNEAAFIAFVTAGYPTAKGMWNACCLIWK